MTTPRREPTGISITFDRPSEGDLWWPSPDITAFVNVTIEWSDGSETTGQSFCEGESEILTIASAMEDAGMTPAEVEEALI